MSKHHYRIELTTKRKVPTSVIADHIVHSLSKIIHEQPGISVVATGGTVDEVRNHPFEGPELFDDVDHLTREDEDSRKKEATPPGLPRIDVYPSEFERQIRAEWPLIQKALDVLRGRK